MEVRCVQIDGVDRFLTEVVYNESGEPAAEDRQRAAACPHEFVAQGIQLPVPNAKRIKTQMHRCDRCNGRRLELLGDADEIEAYLESHSDARLTVMTGSAIATAPPPSRRLFGAGWPEAGDHWEDADEADGRLFLRGTTSTGESGET